jgi:7-cyano-7-deazaguanine reductase
MPREFIFIHNFDIITYLFIEESMSEKDHNNLTLLKHSSTRIPANPDEARLESFPNKYPNRDYSIEFDCPEFTSLCPVTGQPDFARIKIIYVPDQKCLESKSLKLYLGSFRNMGMFHEEITNRVLDDLVAVCEPRWAKVIGIMNPRGGIAITVMAEFCREGYQRPGI